VTLPVPQGLLALPLPRVGLLVQRLVVRLLAGRIEGGAAGEAAQDVAHERGEPAAVGHQVADGEAGVGDDVADAHRRTRRWIARQIAI
jgi:hypothetical protein